MRSSGASPSLPGAESGAGKSPLKKIWRILAIFILVSIILEVVHIVLSEPNVNFGRGDIEVEVVSSQAELTKGLSGRQALPPNHGMLFMFDDDGYQPIWMKDMKFNLDIV